MEEGTIQDFSNISSFSGGNACRRDEEQKLEVQILGLTSVTSTFSNDNVCLSDDIQKMKKGMVEVNSDTTMLTSENVCGSGEKEKMESLRLTSVTSPLLNSNISESERTQNTEDETTGVTSGISMFSSANVCCSDDIQKTEERSMEVTSDIPTLTNENVCCSDSPGKLNGVNSEVTSNNSAISNANACGTDQTEKMEKEALGVSSATSEAINSGTERTQNLETGTPGITCDISKVSNAVVSNTKQKLDGGTNGVTSDASTLLTANVCGSDKIQKMEDRTLGTTSDTSTFCSANVCDRAEIINATPSKCQSNFEKSGNPMKRKKLTTSQRWRLKRERAIAEGKPIPPRKKRPAGLRMESGVREDKPVPPLNKRPAGLKMESAVGEDKPIPPRKKRPARNRKNKDRNVLTNSLIQKKYTYPFNDTKAWCDPSIDEFNLNANFVSHPVGSVVYKDDSFSTQVKPKIFGIQEKTYRVTSNSFTLTGANVYDRFQQNHNEDVLLKSSTQSDNVNFLGKRLSGAQRRKLRKAYLADPMLPREDHLPRPAPKRHNDSMMCPLTPSRDYEPSNKKDANYINTPSLQEGFESFDRSMINYNCGEREAFREPIKSTEVAIIPVEYPNVILIENDFEVIQQFLVGEIADLARKGSKRGPKFEDCCFSRGLVLVTCQDKETEDWLLDQVYKMDNINGIKIKAVNPKQLLNVCKVSVRIPKPLNSLPVRNILLMLQSQNRDLRTLDWDLVDMIEDPSGLTLLLKIDSDSQKVLEAMNYKAYMGLTMINFTSRYQH